MDVGESRVGNYTVWRPVGRLDDATSGAFHTRLVAALGEGGADIILDFTTVDYVSSSGLRALIAAAKAKPPSRRLAIAAFNPVVREVFTISRLHEVIPLSGSVAEVASAWDAAQLPTERRQRVPAASPAIPVRFWGTRGSLPAPLAADAVRHKIRDALLLARQRDVATAAAIDAFIDRELPFATKGTFGGNSACVEIGGGSEFLLCDLGSGVREFGSHLMAAHGPAATHSFNVFLSHVHWDHIMGFPFFAPAYIPGNRIRIHGCHEVLREALVRQQSPPCFPVPFESLAATIEFVTLEPGVDYQIGGFTVRPIRQFHEGESYGYRFSRGGKTIVYSTDCEHKASVLDESYPFVPFFRDADLLIFDAMYSLAEAVSVKEDWGHSSNIIAVELAQLARVKRLVLFHHEPAYDDARIERVLAETIRYEEISREDHKVEILSAYDGLELAV
ncbi:MAG: MBL fold metallo-hydrolase [Thiohalocapsa sp.]